MFWNVVLVGVVVLGGWSVFSIWRSVSELNAQVGLAQKLVDDATTKNQQLRTNVASVSESYIVESAARVGLNKRKPGEQVVLVTGTTSAPVPTMTDPEPILWWNWIFPQKDTTGSLAVSQ